MSNITKDTESLPEYVELNLSNYSLADVEQLNTWGIWAHSEIERLHQALLDSQREVAAVFNAAVAVKPAPEPPQPGAKDRTFLASELRNIAEEMEGDKDFAFPEDPEYLRRAAAWLQPSETYSPLTSCPYCNRPAASDGSIIHLGRCIGLEKVDLNRLQYDALVKRGPTPKAAAPLGTCSRCDDGRNACVCGSPMNGEASQEGQS